MHKQTGSPCEELLQQWSAKRELANYRKSARKLPSFKREMNGASHVWLCCSISR